MLSVILISINFYYPCAIYGNVKAGANAVFKNYGALKAKEIAKVKICTSLKSFLCMCYCSISMDRIAPAELVNRLAYFVFTI